MTARQDAALAHFDAFYPDLLSAIEAEDAEAIGSLVAERQAAVEDLLLAFAGSSLPEGVANHIEGSEAVVQIRLSRFFDNLLLRMAAERSFAFAVGRYEEASR